MQLNTPANHLKASQTMARKTLPQIKFLPYHNTDKLHYKTQNPIITNAYSHPLHKSSPQSIIKQPKLKAHSHTLKEPSHTIPERAYTPNQYFPPANTQNSTNHRCIPIGSQRSKSRSHLCPIAKSTLNCYNQKTHPPRNLKLLPLSYPLTGLTNTNPNVGANPVANIIIHDTCLQIPQDNHSLTSRIAQILQTKVTTSAPATKYSQSSYNTLTCKTTPQKVKHKASQPTGAQTTKPTSQTTKKHAYNQQVTTHLHQHTTVNTNNLPSYQIL
eukprot:gene13004-8850_t